MARRTPESRRGRPLADARRSRRLFCPPDHPALSRKVAIEQDFVAEHMGGGVRPQRLLASRDRSKIEARTAAAQDDRGYHHMEPVETSRLQEARHRGGTALDKDSPQAALGE